MDEYDEPDYDMDAMLEEQDQLEMDAADEFARYEQENGFGEDDDVDKEMKQQDKDESRNQSTASASASASASNTLNDNNNGDDDDMNIDASSYSTTATYKPKLLTPAEIVLALQHNRQVNGIASSDSSASMAAYKKLNETKLITSLKCENITKIDIATAKKYLHSRPVLEGEGESERESENGNINMTGASGTGTLVHNSNSSSRGVSNTTCVGDDTNANANANAHVTCILANGDRVFLGRRRSSYSIDDSSVCTSLGTKEGLGLLSQPMSTLMEEARLLQIHTETQAVVREERAARIATSTSAKRNVNKHMRMTTGYGDSDGDGDGNIDMDMALGDYTNDNDNDINVDEGSTLGTTDKELWVSKHAPQSFSQLLSSEKTNRDVLRSIKLWDRYVFKKQSATLDSHSNSNSNSNSNSSSNGNSNFNNYNKGDSNSSSNDNSSNINNNNSDDARPEHKVILLSGPPGTGKTTLAHIVAKHCGYRPYEINASDDRTVDVLKTHVTNAMNGSTISMIGEIKNQPNCLILDEIDGIDSRSSIDALIGFIKQPLKKKKSNGSSSRFGGIRDGDNVDGDENNNNNNKNKSNSNSNSNSNSSGKVALTRPMICICNDQFSPVLRELRKYCQIFTFQPPAEKRLVQRLKAICVLEKLPSVNVATLQTLVTASLGDIRSCINTLQFASLRASASIAKETTATVTSTFGGGSAADNQKMSTILSSLIRSGLKDQSRDVFQVWNEIFSQHSVKVTIAAKRARLVATSTSTAGTGTGTGTKTVGVDINEQTALTSLRGPIMECMSGMQECGDMQLVLKGIFHNLPNVHYPDPSFNRTSTANEWLSLSDVMEKVCYNNSGDGFFVMAYMPVVAGAIHHLCSSDNKIRSKLAWPTKARDMYYKQKQNENILFSLQLGNHHNHSDSSSSTSSLDAESSSAGVQLSIANLSPTLRSKQIIVLDLLPFLLDIIQPKVRPVAFITLGAGEQEAIRIAVRAMASTGLSYRMQVKVELPLWRQKQLEQYGKGGDVSTVTLALEPAIHQITQFNSHSNNNNSNSNSNSNNTGRDNGRDIETDIQNRRRWNLPYETKNNIFLELKRYLIQMSDRQYQHQNQNQRSASASDDASSPSSREFRSPTQSVPRTPTRSGVSSGTKRGLAAVMASPMATAAVLAAENAEKIAKKTKFDSPQKGSSVGGSGSGSGTNTSSLGSHFKRVNPPTTVATASASAVAIANAAASEPMAAHSFFRTTSQNAISMEAAQNLHDSKNSKSKSKTAQQIQNDKSRAGAGAGTGTGRGMDIDGNGNGMDSQSITSVSVRFKFNQGFSSAVRRPVNISEFL
jgi:DNA polymerase III delta prime subunit